MKTSFYKITTIFIAILMSSTVFAQKNILYVGVTDDPVDTYLTEFLDLQGYSITFVSQDDYKLAPYDNASAYDGYDALFISEVVGSGSIINYKTAGFPIPCVSTEGYCVRTDKWAFLSNDDTQFRQAHSNELTTDVFTLIIEDADHWIASNYDANYSLIWSTAEDPTTCGVTGYKLNENIPEAVELGIFLQDIMQEFPSLWAIPEGSTLISDNSVVLPNIVIIGAISTGLGEYATEEFNLLVVNSLRWVTGDYESGISDIETNPLKVWPNPTNGIVNLSFTLPVSENVQINIYDIAGSLVKNTDPKFLSAGYNSIDFDISEMNAAQYIYEIIAEDGVLRGKICKY